jgi:hypothetical protein
VADLRDPTEPNAPSEFLPSRQPVMYVSEGSVKGPASAALDAPPDDVLADEAPAPDVVSKAAGKEKQKSKPSVQSIVFAVFFSGEGNLAKTMRRAGVRCLEPDDFASGGTDLSDKAQVQRARQRLRDIRTADEKLAIHLAPPCHTYSRARDRSPLTQLRSSSFPAGLPDLPEEQQEDAEMANRIADNTEDFAEWAAKELKAVVFLENPRRSYLWLYLAGRHSPSAVLAWRDFHVSQCLFGTPYKKDLAGEPRSGFPNRRANICQTFESKRKLLSRDFRSGTRKSLSRSKGHMNSTIWKPEALLTRTRIPPYAVGTSRATTLADCVLRQRASPLAEKSTRPLSLAASPRSPQLPIRVRCADSSAIFF